MKGLLQKRYSNFLNDEQEKNKLGKNIGHEKDDGDKIVSQKLRQWENGKYRRMQSSTSLSTTRALILIAKRPKMNKKSWKKIEQTELLKEGMKFIQSGRVELNNYLDCVYTFVEQLFIWLV